MSFDATQAAWKLMPDLERKLAEYPDRRHKPNVAHARTVVLRLADKYQDDRGYVDESYAQLADAIGISQHHVKNCLRAFDYVGLTQIVKRGGRATAANEHGNPTRRALLFLSARQEHTEIDVVEAVDKVRPECAPGAHRDRRGSGANSVRVSANSVRGGANSVRAKSTPLPSVSPLYPLAQQTPEEVPPLTREQRDALIEQGREEDRLEREAAAS